MFCEFPKWLYHHKHEPQVVQTPDEQEALGAEWAARPDLVRQYESKTYECGCSATGIAPLPDNCGNPDHATPAVDPKKSK
jgi:hypothetical protein